MPILPWPSCCFSPSYLFVLSKCSCPWPITYLQDVVGRIRSFSEKGPRAVCILSANGSISNATLHQPGSSGGTLTYEV